MKWLKYRHKWSDGPESVYTYLELSLNDGYFLKNGEFDAVSYIQDFELCNKYNYSEHYRGIDYEVIDCPPKNVLEEKIKNTKRAIEHYKQRVESYTNLLNKVY